MKRYKCIINKVFANTEESFRDEFTRLLYLYGMTFKIDTNTRAAIFLANVLAEIRVLKSGKVAIRENLNYDSKGLISTFKFFRTHPKLALMYGRGAKHKADQVAIANLAYAWKLGNRGPESCDGYRFRGTGILQDTGKDNILKDSKFLEDKLFIKILDDSGVLYEGFYDSYFGAIMLGFAYFNRSGMYECNSMDCAVDIINKHTRSRDKRQRLYYKVLKKIKECGGV